MKSSFGLTITNPVLSFAAEMKKQPPFDPIGAEQRLLAWLNVMEDQGARFPQQIRQKFFYSMDEVQLQPSKPPRVVGLLVDCDSDPHIGLVTPIKSQKSSRGLVVDHSLPFHAGHVQDALFRLLSESGQKIENKIPELVAFELSEQLNEQTSGTSMNIAGLLAVIDAFNDFKHAILEYSCAVVEPDGNELKAVGSINTKLEAFVREYERGSLLVRHTDCDVAASFDQYFDHVWPVCSFADLGSQLSSCGLMSGVLAAFPVTQATVEAAKLRIGWLAQEKNNLGALGFAQRLEAANDSTGKSLLRVSQSIQTLLEDQNRHNGRYYQAILHSRKAVQQLEALAGLSSFNEVVDAKVRLAAGLFDGHDFSMAIDLMQPLIERVDADESLITAESQINLYNTMGRAKAIGRQAEWELWFQNSRELQSKVDPQSVPRTASYLIQGLLHHGRLEEAIQEIDDVLGQDSYTDLFLKFYKADWYRRSGEQTWVDPDLDSNGHGYIYGFYLQATARQSGRESDDTVDRLNRAAHEMCREVPEHSDMNILQLFAYFARLAATVVGEDKSETESVLRSIQSFMNEPQAAQIKNWYEGKIPSSPKKLTDLESLFDAVPYF